MIPLPKQPGGVALWRYRLALTGWRVVPQLARVAGIAAAIAFAIWLSGFRTPQWIAVTDPSLALPAEQWPVIPDEAKPLILADDGNALTLTAQDLRVRLNQVHANAIKASRGEPVVSVASDPVAVTPGSASDTVATTAYAAWVSGSACSISGWQGEARGQVAALVRNGTWSCSGFKRFFAYWPLVIDFGLILGILGSLLLLIVVVGAIFHFGREIRRTEQDASLHRQLFGSWVR